QKAFDLIYYRRASVEIGYGRLKIACKEYSHGKDLSRLLHTVSNIKSIYNLLVFRAVLTQVDSSLCAMSDRVTSRDVSTQSYYQKLVFVVLLAYPCVCLTRVIKFPST